MTSKLHPVSYPAQTSRCREGWQRLWSRFPHFLVAGGISTAVHWSAMSGLMAWDIPALWASSVGAAAGALTNYWLQKGYVFRCVKSHERVVLLYLASVVGSWVANLILLGILYQWAGVNIAYAQLMTTSLVCLMNFQVQRRVFL